MQELSVHSMSRERLYGHQQPAASQLTRCFTQCVLLHDLIASCCSCCSRRRPLHLCGPSLCSCSSEVRGWHTAHSPQACTAMRCALGAILLCQLAVAAAMDHCHRSSISSR